MLKIRLIRIGKLASMVRKSVTRSGFFISSPLPVSQDFEETDESVSFHSCAILVRQAAQTSVILIIY